MMGYYCQASLLTVENRWFIERMIYCVLFVATLEPPHLSSPLWAGLSRHLSTVCWVRAGPTAAGITGSASWTWRRGESTAGFLTIMTPFYRSPLQTGTNTSQVDYFFLIMITVISWGFYLIQIFSFPFPFLSQCWWMCRYVRWSCFGSLGGERLQVPQGLFSVQAEHQQLPRRPAARAPHWCLRPLSSRVGITLWDALLFQGRIIFSVLLSLLCPDSCWWFNFSSLSSSLTSFDLNASIYTMGKDQKVKL